MKGLEFQGRITGWPGMRGQDIFTAIMKTLNEYEGDDDNVHMQLFIVPKNGKEEVPNELFFGLDAMWDDTREAWTVLKYH